jgi:hypothetical protein
MGRGLLPPPRFSERYAVAEDPVPYMRKFWEEKKTNFNE